MIRSKEWAHEGSKELQYGSVFKVQVSYFSLCSSVLWTMSTSIDCAPSQQTVDAMIASAVSAAAAAAATTASSAQTHVGSSAAEQSDQPSKHQQGEQTQMEVEEGRQPEQPSKSQAKNRTQMEVEKIVCPGPASAALLVHCVPVKLPPEFLYPLLNMRLAAAVLHLTEPQLTKSRRHYKVLAVFSSAANADLAFKALSGEESFDNYGLPMKQHFLIEGVTIYVTKTLETKEQSMNAHKVLRLESATMNLS
jgi:hypothetical protein